MDIVESLFRWAHVVAGIIWIGLLYFFNWVNGPFAATLEPECKRKVIPELLPRALFWFRWGAAWTWVTGLLLLTVVFYHVKGSDEVTHNATLWAGEADSRTIGIALIVFTFLSMHVYDILVKTVFKTTQIQFVVGIIWATAWVYLLQEVGGFSYRATTIHLGAMFGTWMAFNVWFRIWPAQRRIITAIKNGDAPAPADPALAGLRSKHNTYMSIPLVLMMVAQHKPWMADKIWMVGVMVAVGWIVCRMLYKKAANVPGF